MSLTEGLEMPYLQELIADLSPTSLLVLGDGPIPNLMPAEGCRTNAIDTLYCDPQPAALTGLPACDVVLVKDGLDHLAKPRSMEMLVRCMARARTHLLVSNRLGRSWTHLLSGQPAAGSGVEWYASEFLPLAQRAAIIDTPFGPYGVFSIPKCGGFAKKIAKVVIGRPEGSGAAIRTHYRVDRAALDRIDLSYLARHVPDAEHRRQFLDTGFREHYRLIAHLSTCFHNAVLFDIGTNKGYSALALSHNPANRVVSYDIVDLRDLDDDAKLHRIEFQIGDVMKDERLLASPLIVLDTDHDGRFEAEFYRFLRRNRYRGLLSLDDIHLSRAMIEFWNTIEEPKVDLTDIGHFSGSALVDFSTGAWGGLSAPGPLRSGMRAALGR